MATSRPTRAAAALALAVALGVAGCGGEESGGKASGSTPSASTSPPASTAPSPIRAKGATVIQGTGYSFALPKGWVDLTRKMRRSQPSLDVAVGNAVQTDGFASNLAVTVPEIPASGAGTDSGAVIDDIAAQILAEVKDNAPRYRVHEHTEVAGAPAAHLAGIYRSGQQRYWLEQFVVLGSERAIVISFSLSATSSEQARNQLIDTVLKSWMIDP